jgi:phage tail sheath gpL-like
VKVNTTTADGPSSIAIEWATEQIQVGVSSGDTAIAQAAAVAAAINADPYLPFVATVGSSPNDHKVTATMVQLGPRGDYVMDALRVRYLKTIASSVSKAAITSGTGADDVTLALAAISGEFYYHVPSCTATTTVTATDNGVGEYVQAIRDRALPATGYDEQVVFGLDCTQAQATSVAISSGANSVYASFFHVEDNDWPPWMVAAHCAAVKRSQEVVYPAANLAGYTQTDTTVFAIPDPWDKTDRPTVTEQKADLNNGVTPIAFTANGRSYIVRQITSYNVLSTGLKDYRAREGHIPSVVHFFWEELLRRYAAQKQPNRAADPPKGVKPIPGYDYPRTIKALVYRCIDDMAGEFSNQKALLDSSPDAIRRMKESTTVTLQPGGFFVNVLVEPVVHNLFDDFLVNQGGSAY